MMRDDVQLHLYIRPILQLSLLLSASHETTVVTVNARAWQQESDLRQLEDLVKVQGGFWLFSSLTVVTVGNALTYFGCVCVCTYIWHWHWGMKREKRRTNDNPKGRKYKPCTINPYTCQCMHKTVDRDKSTSPYVNKLPSLLPAGYLQNQLTGSFRFQH